MTGDRLDATAPRACGTRDLSALIGLLALVEAELMAGEVPPHSSERIRRRLEGSALLEPGGTDQDLRRTINDLNHRLRYALGEYDQPPSTYPVPE